MTATLTKWYEERGRHEIFAGNRRVPLDSVEHAMVLRQDIITTDVQHDLDRLGIAKTAREEKLRARNERLRQQAAEDERMARLYREIILKEKPAEPLVTIQPAPKPAVAEEREEVGSFGD